MILFLDFKNGVIDWLHFKDKGLEILLKSESLNGLLFTFFKIKGVFA